MTFDGVFKTIGEPDFAFGSLEKLTSESIAFILEAYQNKALSIWRSRGIGTLYQHYE